VADTVQEGSDITIISYGSTIREVKAAADLAQ
jgi:pyruvate/2-oxoglutarate/acetoin dehydrogenase E1 component